MRWAFWFYNVDCGVRGKNVQYGPKLRLWLMFVIIEIRSFWWYFSVEKYIWRNQSFWVLTLSLAREIFWKQKQLFCIIIFIKMKYLHHFFIRYSFQSIFIYNFMNNNLICHFFVFVWIVSHFRRELKKIHHLTVITHLFKYRIFINCSHEFEYFYYFSFQYNFLFFS